MGRDLKVTYFPDSISGSLAWEGVPHDYTDDLTPEQHQENERYYEAKKLAVEYSRNWERNVDLGYLDHFSGTPIDLQEELSSMLDDAKSHSDYTAIGNLYLIVGECPEDYEYIVINND